ncbi:endoplasmic reticulum protein [Pseudohyphozyma bogoriensis]|nr:endoplasmic reticulum protein [Pseudohyphozyma bogoriensis]
MLKLDPGSYHFTAQPAAPFAREPLRTLYLLTTAITTLLICPIWIVLYYTSLNHFPTCWTLKESLIVQIQRRMAKVVPATDYTKGVNPVGVLPVKTKLKHTRGIVIDPAPKELVRGILRTAEAEGVGAVKTVAYIYGKDRDGDGVMKVDEGEKVVLFLHGGALLVGNAGEDYSTAQIPKELLKRTTISSILSVDYRKIRDGPFPAALIDCFTAWHYLTRTVGIAPDRIILAGDSAGGHLCLALTRYLRDEFLECPNSMLLYSPWTDMSYDLGPKHDRLRLASDNVDYLNRDALQPYIAIRLLSLSPISLLDGPYLSPASPTIPAKDLPGIFKDFPPTFLTAGGVEALLANIRETARRMELAGMDFVYDEQPDAIHNYQTHLFFQPAMRERIWVKSAAWLQARIDK